MNNLKVIQTESLKLWLPFQEGSGTVANDRSGNANHCTLDNNPPWVDGKIGKASSLNGSTQCGSLSAALDWGGRTSFTLTGWIKRNSPALGIIAARYNGGVIAQWLWHIDAAGKHILHREAPPFTNVISTTALQAGQWYFIAATYDGSTRKLYTNGLTDGSIADTTSVAFVTHASLPTNIGCNLDNGTPANHLNGEISHISAYTGVALSDKEIAAQFFTQKHIFGG